MRDLGQRARTLAESLSLDVLAGQLLVGGYDGTELPAQLLTALAAGHRAGAIVFRRNVPRTESGDVDVLAMARACATVVSACPAELPPLLAIDQEGGRVMRLGRPVLQPPPMRLLGETHNLALIEETARVAGEQLRALGFSMSFAPVFDVDTNPDNPVIGDRSFARDPDFVAAAGIAYAKGLERSGVLSCGKHFPGHGDTALDSHLALPRVTHDRARIDAIELAPFRRAIAAGIDSLMTAHVVFDALAPGVPATLAPSVVTDLLRKELGFAGVCFSDDLFMRGVSPHGGADANEVADIGERALDAGCDVLLFANETLAIETTRRRLAERAANDRGFEARLRASCARFLEMRMRAVPAPILDESSLHEVMTTPAAAALSARFDELRAKA